ncbi:hypothetical protein BT69DRAFT_1286876 [Atractiella rhizophila]|nr:hypothetical protein BT69DRAFT_1286876 [Atractiella rhizophila]
MSLPTHVYKLIPSAAAPPTPLPLSLPLSELDTRSAFIHLSTSSQVQNTLVHFFKDEKDVWILRIPFERVKEKVKWESPDLKVCGERPEEGLFPHIYNGKLGSEEVDSVRKVERGTKEWGDALKEHMEWLVS